MHKWMNDKDGDIGRAADVFVATIPNLTKVELHDLDYLRQNQEGWMFIGAAIAIAESHQHAIPQYIRDLAEQ